MTDLEMTKLCAEAMGIKTEVHPIRGKILRHWYMDRNVEREYNPLYDDAQALALVKRFDLRIRESTLDDWRVAKPAPILGVEFASNERDLNRAIVECVASMQLAAA